MAARIGWASALLAAAALCACQPQGSSSKSQSSQAAAAAAGPQNACMQLVSAPGQPQKFRPVAYDDQNLETCAVHLEGVRLEQGHDVVGVWNGVWIFAGSSEVDSSTALNASRYAVFDADQHAQIDQSLRDQLAAQKQASSKPGAPPSP